MVLVMGHSICFYCVLGRVVFNPVPPRKAKIVCNFGLSECNRVKLSSMLHLILQRNFFIYIKKNKTKKKQNKKKTENKKELGKS